MIKTIFLVVMFSFIVIVVGTNNAYAQFDKSREREQESTLAAVNLTDKMKYRCLQIDASGLVNRIEDKEFKEKCEEFLDHVSISEMKELIEKYKKK